MIVAYDEGRVIGNKGKIPWDIPEDRRHFARVTKGCKLIMGANTYKSLTRPDGQEPLPKRPKWVVCRAINNPQWGTSISSLRWAADLARISKEPFWIMGGGQMYRAAIDYPDLELIVTSEVKGRHEGDVWFPEIDRSIWQRWVMAKYERFTVCHWTRRQSVKVDET